MARGQKLAGVVTLIAAVAIGLAGCKKKPVAADGSPAATNGWSDQEKALWYNTGQGSRLMPMDWFKALEQPGAAGRFSDPGYLAGFGILPPMAGSALPVGFAESAIDDSKLVKTSLHWTGVAADKETVKWVGLTCAACHTAQITYKDETAPITIEGAPSLFDFQRFIEALDTALVETRASAEPGADPARWNRFAGAVLGQADSPEARKRLQGELDKLIAWEAAAAALNAPDPRDPNTNSRYGFGRVDAVGHIYNRILLFGGAPQPRKNPSDAPVSYPHLWNITKQSRLQWNGIAQTAKVLTNGVTPTDFGALGRNAGEVLGVFGEVIIKKPAFPGDPAGFDSSVDVENLNRIEVALTRLTPPKWRASFGTPGDIDVKDDKGARLSAEAVVKSGEGLFTARCAACHTPHKTYETIMTFAQMQKGGNLTDEWMACNAWDYTGASGKLNGVPADYLKGKALGPNAQVAALLTTSVKGTLAGKKMDVVKIAAENFFGTTPLPRGGPQAALVPGQTEKDRRLQRCLQLPADQQSAANLAYKARPLEGIWATAPYLHNGSVPTLYDLLLPVEQRPATFSVGTRAFDPKKVGYETAPTAPGNGFIFDTARSGNSNKGHVYGVGGLTEAQRLQLLEYLKTL